MKLRLAKRKQAKIRVSVSGISGSGKTYSSLLLAKGITGDWSKVVLIDTENGSGDLYSDLGPYNIITLEPPYSPERFIEAIKACEDAGMECVVIDSATHEWDGPGGCLELVDSIAKASRSGNSYVAWGQVTPRHKKFIEKIVSSKCHMICTTRKKNEYSMDKVNGRTQIKRVGTKEIQREGFEYEMTIAFDVSREHLAKTDKDRTGIFSERDPFVITEETGKQIIEWCNSGEPVKEEPKIEIKTPKLPTEEQVARIYELAEEAGFEKKQADVVVKSLTTFDEADKKISALEAKISQKKIVI